MLILLAKVNKSPYGSLQNITPYDTCSITVHERTMTLSDIIIKQKW